jgi:hypothetical protein
MIESYLNKKGKVIIIAEMVNEHLLRSYKFFREIIRNSKNKSFMLRTDTETTEIFNTLKSEVKKRKLTINKKIIPLDTVVLKL